VTTWRLPGPSRLLVAVIAALAGLLLATSAVTARGTDLRSDRRLQLADLLARQRDELQGREQQAAALRGQVARETALGAARDTRAAQQQRQLAPVALAAGLVPVRGPALTVDLDDAPPGATSADPDDLVVHQQDVQAVVNALWSGGAEAMTLMGQRVISTSAVRCVGNTVVLHGQVYGPPFVVTAIGDRQRMRDSLAREPGVELFQRYVEAFGLGYRVRAEDDVHLPAYDGPLELAAAVGQAS